MAGKYSPSDPREWLSIAADFEPTAFADLQAAGQSLLFAFACRVCSTEASKVLVLSFETAHNLESFEAPSSAWHILKESLISDWYSFEWDRCRQLRRTVVSRWVKCSFDAALFLELVRDPELFRELCRDAKSVPGGMNLLDQAARYAISARDDWSARAKAIIDKEMARAPWLFGF